MRRQIQIDKGEAQCNELGAYAAEVKNRACKINLCSSVDCYPTMARVAGKAGKSYVLVQVGEVTNLCKTSKSSASQNRQPTRKVIILDLHGLTKVDALARLDASLPRVDIAMKGEYPCVIPVNIICGEGKQILAEAVTRWIQKNIQVANETKRIYA